MILLIAGGRDYDDANAVREALSPYNQVGNVLMTGAGRGADDLAVRFVLVRGHWKVVASSGMPGGYSLLRKLLGFTDRYH